MTAADMLARMPEATRAVLMMTANQVRASWVREQKWNRAHGMPYYTRLTEQASRDPRTRRVVASLADD